MRNNRFKSIVIVLVILFSSVCQNYAQTFKERAEFDGPKSEIKHLFFYEMQYPSEALETHIQGIVELFFTVMPNASIEHIEVTRSVSDDIDQEAIRLLKLMRWKPAVVAGKKLACRKSLKIKFNVNKYKKHCKERGYDKLQYPYEPIGSSFRIYKSGEVDQIPKPVFTSGLDLDKFILQEMKYPEEAYNRSLSGKVKLIFVVEKNGKVTHVDVKNAVGGGCDQEAIRILRLLDWMPGIKDKKAVRTEACLDITFHLTDDSEHFYLPNNQNNSM